MYLSEDYYVSEDCVFQIDLECILDSTNPYLPPFRKDLFLDTLNRIRCTGENRWFDQCILVKITMLVKIVSFKLISSVS